MSEERKLVTILFADVTGSTALGDSLDPEDVRALMGRYYTHARTVVTQHGGTIEKFIGDAVMAIFGLPQAHGDDAERALAAALALREAVARDEILGEAFQLRIGVNTGEVMATSDPSSGDFLVTGDAVNVSARLQQTANPGEIVAGERTAAATQHAFLFEDERMTEVKGKRLPLRVFPLRGRREVRQTNRPPLVGRKQDLMQLSLLQARALEELRPQLVSIVAPAGTGKTRLLEEFLKRLDPDDGFEVATVRCLPYGQTLTYWPMRGLLSGLLGAEINKNNVLRIFSEGGYKPDEASRLTDLILTTLGIEGESMAMKDRESIFAAWRLLIEVFAREAPRILVFEDLHWASDSMLDLVEHIISLRTQTPILLIALSRPELLDRRPGWGGGRQNFTALALQPLSAKQTQELITKLTVDMPEETRAQIVERSGGNPFFALELIRGLHERGLTGQSATLDMLPDTVHAAVLARLDLLTRKERTVLQVAAVASRAIRASMLQAVLDNITQMEIESALDGLLARDMLVPAEGGAFAFRHILIRDVAYGTLSRSERIRLHSKIAAWLEREAGERTDEYAELIAYHYREAVLLARQSAVPKAMPVETERAVYFLKRAGELAGRAGAFAEVRNYLQSAIALAPAAEHGALYELLGDSLPWGDASAEAYMKSIECWRQSSADKDEPAQQLTGARRIRKLLILNNRGLIQPKSTKEEMEKLLQEALHLAEHANNTDEHWRVRVAGLFFAHRFEEITPERIEKDKKEALEAATYFEACGDWPACSEALDACSTPLMKSGLYDETLEIIQRRLQMPDLSAKEYGDAVGMLINLYFLSGRYELCISKLHELLTQESNGARILYLGNSIQAALISIYLSGRWTMVSLFTNVLRNIIEQTQYDSSVSMSAYAAYTSLFFIALAREDRPALDAAQAMLVRGFSDGIRPLLEAHREDNFEKLGDDYTKYELFVLVQFLNEHNIQMPLAILERMERNDSIYIDAVKRMGYIARALLADDNALLAEAIEDAEAHGLIVHATRMRIVLAQRTGDRSQLERARPVLEHLEDRMYLKKLEEVAALL